MRMFNRGTAGDEDIPELPPPPEWASKAAKELAAALDSVAEDAPVRAKKSANKKTSAGKKKSASKKKSQA
jgi:hypothetical protein